MSIELIPKSELPIWSEKDEERKNEYIDCLRSGKLHLVSAKDPSDL
ncbi:MAG: hypothetical protein R1F52_06655 [Candidatus Nitrosoabyssus spongiisocia]|nr:MAG: hypothetical protein R1F52_06655 [Nitrosopumilaceae archaeon AB1(1)]